MKCPECGGIAAKIATTNYRICVIGKDGKDACGHKFIDTSEPEWESFNINLKESSIIETEELIQNELDGG